MATRLGQPVHNHLNQHYGTPLTRVHAFCERSLAVNLNHRNPVSIGFLRGDTNISALFADDRLGERG